MQPITLISDAEAVSKACGFDVIQRLLFTQIRLDAQPFVTPLMLRDGGTEHIVVRQQETGNMLSSGADADMLLFYEPWVSIDRRVLAGTEVRPTLADLLAPIVGDRVLRLNAGVVRAHHELLRERMTVEVDPAPARRVQVTDITDRDVLDWFAAARQSVEVSVRDILRDVPHLASLAALVGTSADTRFTSLRGLIALCGVDAILISSSPNYSELSAERYREGSWLVVHPEGGTIHRVTALASPEDGSAATATERGARDFDSLAAAVSELTRGKRLAIEEKHLSAALALELEAEGFTLTGVSTPLGDWRDTRDQEDLATQIIAARATTEAIEEALDNARTRVECGESFTEQEVYESFIVKLAEFESRHALPVRLEPYFANLTASERMLFPGPPTDFPVGPETRCLQLDAGIRVTRDGVVLATSDMARTLALTEPAREAYALLTDVMRNTTIASLRPGVALEEVHARTMEALTEIRGELERLGVMSPEVDFVSAYRGRNVGHLMGKQESFANELRPGFTQTLPLGSIGAAEIPWRFGEYSLATEDMWFVGEQETLNLTLRSH